MRALFGHIQGSYKIAHVDMERRGGIFSIVCTAGRIGDPVDYVCDMLQQITNVEIRKTRKRGTVTPIRHVAMYLLCRRYGYSYHQAASAMGLKCHASAYWACREMEGQNVQGNLEQVTRRLLVERSAQLRQIWVRRAGKAARTAKTSGKTKSNRQRTAQPPQ